MPKLTLLKLDDETNQLLKDLKNARCKTKTTCCESQSEEQLVLIDEQIRYERRFVKELEECQTKLNVLEEKVTKYSELKREMEILRDEEGADTRDLKEREIVLELNKSVQELVEEQRKRGGLVMQAREELIKRRENTVDNDRCSIL